MSEIKHPRLNLYLPLEMQSELKTKAKQADISVSELVRRIIDEWLTSERSNKPNVTSFDALTEEELRMFVTNRFLELARYAVSQDHQVREIQRKAADAGLTVEQWIRQNKGIEYI